MIALQTLISQIAIDGERVWIRKPLKSKTEYFCYKDKFSIVLLAGVNANYKFVFIDVGSKGRFGDANIFENGTFGRCLMAGELEVPEPAPL